MGLLEKLNENNYKNYGEQVYKTGSILYQKKFPSGCFVNFYYYPASEYFLYPMAEVEISFECDKNGMWCNHKLYGLNADEMGENFERIELKLLAIYELLEGYKYKE